MDERRSSNVPERGPQPPHEPPAEGQRAEPFEQAQQALHGATERVREQAESRKEAAAGRVAGAAEALHRAAGAFEESVDPTIARYVEELAGTLSRVSDGIRHKSAAEFLGDIEDIARRNPTLFFAGAFAAGIFLGRVARSSRRHERDDEHHGGDEDERGEHDVEAEEGGRGYQASRAPFEGGENVGENLTDVELSPGRPAARTSGDNPPDAEGPLPPASPGTQFGAHPTHPFEDDVRRKGEPPHGE